MIPASLTTIRELTSFSALQFLSLAESIKANPVQYSSTLKGKTILQFFVENSTRTRMSFETATRKMGGVSLGFAAGSSSLSKGESLLDTVYTIQQLGIDAIVMRHHSGGAPDLVAKASGKPVINAGDGSHEHPTQALLDSFTLGEYFKSSFQKEKPFAGKSILILGDTLHSRVARSNIHLLTKLGAKVILSGPKNLTIRNLELFPKVEVDHFPDRALREADAVIALRIQTERQAEGLIPSHAEYRHFWGLTTKRAQLLKPGTVVLHPGPMNRGIEIDSEVADSEKSLVLKQVENGVFVRMAVLAKLVAEVNA